MEQFKRSPIGVNDSQFPVVGCFLVLCLRDLNPNCPSVAPRYRRFRADSRGTAARSCYLNSLRRGKRIREQWRFRLRWEAEIAGEDLGAIAVGVLHLLETLMLVSIAL